MTNEQSSALVALRAALQETTPTGCSEDGDISTSAASPLSFRPTQALAQQRDLLTRFINASGIDLTSNHCAAKVGAQLHALTDGIRTHVDDAYSELKSACEGLELFVSLIDQGHLVGVNPSQIRGLLHPLLNQLTRASNAVGEVL